jgi:hypothetical protein
MRSVAAVVAGVLLAVTPALPVSKVECYKASRELVWDLFGGRYEKLGPPPAADPAGWPHWLATEFPATSTFTAFGVVAEEHRGSGCQARIRLETAGGQVFALFIDLDGELHPTSLRSLREVLGARTAEMSDAVDKLRAALPRVTEAGVGDAGLLPLLRRVRGITRDSDRDITNFIEALEGVPVELPKRPHGPGSSRRM